MSTLKVEKIQHPNSASVALTLDTSGYLALQAGSASTPAIQGPSDPNTGIFFPAADTIAFAEGGTEVLRIDSSGRVGIGTTSAIGLLQLKYASNVNTSFRNSSAAGLTAGTLVEAVNDGFSSFTPYYVRASEYGFGTDSGGTYIPRFTIDSSGRVGIGITSLSTSRQVEILQTSGYDSGLRIRTNGSGAYTEYFSGVSNWKVGSGNSVNGLEFVGDGVERVRIDSAGRLLINTTTPAYNENLNVVRNNTTTNDIVANFYNSASTTTTKLDNAIIRVSSNASGADAYINITDNTSHNYNFGGNNGGAYVVANTNGVRLSNGGTSWASDSDERVKDIIEPITEGLNKISTLRTVIGKYKTDEENKRRSFLIAQDVQAVLPEAVYDEQGILMLAYTDVIPLLVSALKESKERIEKLEADVEALKN